MTPREEIIDKIQDLLLKEGKILQNDKEMPKKDKLDKVDVLLNLVKFLDNYDENIEILNKHIRENRWKGDRNER